MISLRDQSCTHTDIAASVYPRAHPCQPFPDPSSLTFFYSSLFLLTLKNQNLSKQDQEKGGKGGLFRQSWGGTMLKIGIHDNHNPSSEDTSNELIFGRSPHALSEILTSSSLVSSLLIELSVTLNIHHRRNDKAQTA